MAADTLSEAHLLQAKRYAESGQLLRALTCIDQALDLAQKGPEDQQYAAILNNRGEIKRKLAEQFKDSPLKCVEYRDGAIADLLESIRVKEQLYGKDSLIVARAFDNLGSAYMIEPESKMELAEGVFRKALTIREMKQGRGHLDTLNELLQLSQISLYQSQWVEAEKLSRRYVSLVRTLGPGNLGIAKGQMILAETLLHERKFGEAKSNASAARKIFTIKVGYACPQSQKCMNIEKEANDGLNGGTDGQ